MSTRAVENSYGDASTQPIVAKVTGRRVEFDYLRAFVIVLVLYFHAILAYTYFAQLNPENPVLTFSPVVDRQRWLGFDLTVSLLDAFFMSLMFFISGLFAWRSLTRKGVRKYVGDRLRRLGIPFVIVVSLLMPLVLYPAQLRIEQTYGVSLS